MFAYNQSVGLNMINVKGGVNNMFKLFKNFTKKDGMLLLTAIVFIVAQVWLDLKLPDYMSEITILV